MLLGEFDRTRGLAHLPIRNTPVALKFIHKDALGIRGGEFRIAARSGKKTRKPAHVMRQVDIIHEFPGFLYTNMRFAR